MRFRLNEDYNNRIVSIDTLREEHLVVAYRTFLEEVMENMYDMISLDDSSIEGVEYETIQETVDELILFEYIFKACDKYSINWRTSREFISFNHDVLFMVNRELYTRLNDIAPPGCYYGGQPGDGACLGFWETKQWESNE